jgi:hypothetical protein
MSMPLGPFGNQIFNTREHSLGSSTPPSPLLPARRPVQSVVWSSDSSSRAEIKGQNLKPSCLVNVLDHNRPRSEIKAPCYSIITDEVLSSFSSVLIIVTAAAARGFIRTIIRKAFVFRALHNDSLEFDFSQTRLTSQLGVRAASSTTPAIALFHEQHASCSFGAAALQPG